MATLQEAIEVYKMNRAYVMLAGINNVVCLYNKSGCRLTRKVRSYIIYGNHQNRVIDSHGKYKYKKTIKACWKELEKAPSIMTMRFQNFEKLYDEVKKRLDKIYLVHHLTIYDVALRLGFILHEPIYPKDYVYIQAGALKGIKNLQKYDGKHIDPQSPLSLPLITGVNRYPISAFRKAFGNLESMFIEDFLCVYDNKLDKLDFLTRKDLFVGMQYHGTFPRIEPCYKYSF